MKMKPIFIVIILLGVLSCKSKKTATRQQKPTKTVTVLNPKRVPDKAKQILNYAQSFEGTPYKYGGIDKRGMDCSGLVQTSFKKYAINLPRTTATLKVYGNWVDLKNVAVGDLLFFATQKNSRNINHVGIVSNARMGHVEFIHASSSKGVITSSLAEKYWYFAFVQARRIL